jgi:N-acyl-D-aspartate/D-glutamate deacylase
LLPTFALFGALVVGLPSGLVAQDYDLIIRNARVLDGAGNPWFRADVAVTGDRIAAVGDLSAATGAREIDARGLYLAPGFIDTHTHAGSGLDDPELSAAEPLIAQGITTILANPDGGGPTDLAAQREALLADGLGVNVGQMIGHGSVRRAVLGNEDRAPSPAELDRMRGIVRAAMEEGAFGLSSGLFYSPGIFAENAEVVELGKVAAEYNGVYQSHLRDEADYTIGVVAATEEVITVAREAGIPGVVTHVKVLGPRVWGFSAALVHRIERAREQGIEVWADQYPYPASATGLGAALVPRWATEGEHEEFLGRVADPATRARILDEMAENLERRGGADRIQFRRVPGEPSLEGRTLAEVATERDEDPRELALELLESGYVGIVSFNMAEEDVRRFMRKPWVMTASDGSLVPMGQGVPHPRGYGTFPRKIREYVLERDVVDLPHAIRSMTSLPARVWRIEDRGVIREGAMADLVVFDLDTIESPATFTDPHQLARGMVHVLVNGTAVVSDGAFTGERPGRMLGRSGS